MKHRWLCHPDHPRISVWSSQGSVETDWNRLKSRDWDLNASASPTWHGHLRWTVGPGTAPREIPVPTAGPGGGWNGYLDGEARLARELVRFKTPCFVHWGHLMTLDDTCWVEVFHFHVKVSRQWTDRHCCSCVGKHQVRLVVLVPRSLRVQLEQRMWTDPEKHIDMKLVGYSWS